MADYQRFTYAPDAAGNSLTATMAWRKKAGLRSEGPVQTPSQRHEAALYEALDYLDRVKTRYTNQPEIFVYFLEVLEDHRSGRTDYFSLVRRIAGLFAENLDLVEGFNGFMPVGYHVEVGAGEGCLIVRITIPDGTSIDTKVHLGSAGQAGEAALFHSGGVNGGGARAGFASSPGNGDTQIRLNVPKGAEEESSRLQMLAELAARPSIAETARDALRARYEPSQLVSPSASASLAKPSGGVPPHTNGANQPFIPPSLRYVQPSGHRVEFASPPRPLLNHMSIDRTMQDSAGSPKSPFATRQDASPKRKFSMVDGSPVQEDRSRNLFHPFPTFTGLRGFEADRKPFTTNPHLQNQLRDPNQSRFIPMRGDEGSSAIRNQPHSHGYNGTALSSHHTNTLNNPHNDQMHNPKPAKKSRAANKRPSGSSTSKSARTHTNRAFPCPFATYGCPATFGSKNEWKRHINTQHMRLGYWRCDLCDQVRPNDFNRKDLFIQHMRRMHTAENRTKTAGTTSDLNGGASTPGAKAALAKNDPEELALNAAASRCWRRIHTPPEQSSCLFCDVKFSGPGTWDERLEHIGRHMEFIVKEGEVVDPARWEKDFQLEEWLIREEIIVGVNGPNGAGAGQVQVKEGEVGVSGGWVLAEGRS